MLISLCRRPIAINVGTIRRVVGKHFLECAREILFDLWFTVSGVKDL